jgi:hypothetical protein
MPEDSRVDDLPAMTMREVASCLSVDEKTNYRFAQRGDLPGWTEKRKRGTAAGDGNNGPGKKAKTKARRRGRT